MKKIYLTLLAVLFVCLMKASAQVPAPYVADYNRMMANQQMAWMNQMSMNRLMSMGWSKGLNYQINNKYEFKVMMKDSSVKVIKSKIYADTVKHKSYLIYTNKDVKKSDPNREQKIYADETVAISRIQPSYRGNYLVEGFGTDSCWLFKVVAGKINGYSHLSEVAELNESYLRAFQYGDNKVVKLDSAALDPIIKADPKAYKPFLKGKFYQAIDKYNSDNKK